MNQTLLLPCLDSDEIAQTLRRRLDILRGEAADLGRSAAEISRNGHYTHGLGASVAIADAVKKACSHKHSIPPEAPLPTRANSCFPTTTIQVSNETTLQACHRLSQEGLRPLALNCANGACPGGGFLHGARAQEELLCRSSALYITLLGDPMYAAHLQRSLPDSSDWAILSPGVPVFRQDNGTLWEQPWHLDFITSAAPYAPAVGKEAAAALLKTRIHRLLAISQAYGYEVLVLGAWGCGARGNQAKQTAADFRHALENDYRGVFSHVLFAIADWSAERKYLGPFRDIFSP